VEDTTCLATIGDGQTPLTSEANQTWGFVYQTYRKPMLRAIQNLLNETPFFEDAEDVLHDCFSAMFRRRFVSGVPEVVEAFCMQAARNAAIDYVGARYHERRQDGIAWEVRGATD